MIPGILSALRNPKVFNASALMRQLALKYYYDGPRFFPYEFPLDHFNAEPYFMHMFLHVLYY
jgi:hypothetical protein